jgi:organic radical activating enzyme
LVITGGCPLLQKEGIEELIKLIPDWEIEIETNGTQMPTPYLLERCRFNCSPKTTNSGNSRQAMRKPEVLKTLNGLEKSCFKFVFTGREDLLEIEEYIDECGLNPDKIYLMPEGTTRENIHEHLLLASEVAKEKGWNLTPRLQVAVWGAVRRV